MTRKKGNTHVKQHNTTTRRPTTPKTKKTLPYTQTGPYSSPNPKSVTLLFETRYNILDIISLPQISSEKLAHLFLPRVASSAPSLSQKGISRERPPRFTNSRGFQNPPPHAAASIHTTCACDGETVKKVAIKIHQTFWTSTPKPHTAREGSTAVSSAGLFTSNIGPRLGGQIYVLSLSLIFVRLRAKEPLTKVQFINTRRAHKKKKK